MRVKLPRGSDEDLIDREQLGQRLDCARRDQCLGTAARRNWDSFTCRDCVAFDPTGALSVSNL